MSKLPEIGTMAYLSPELDSIDRVAEFGLSTAQVCCWCTQYCDLDLARKLKKRLADLNVRMTAFWSGYSGPAQWNFTYGPVTLGIVPVAYREMRVRELKRWADFAAEAGAPAIVTHCGFLPENMTDPEFPGVVMAIKDIAGYCKNLGLGFWFETGQETPVTLLRHIQAVGLDNLGINLDPANLLLYGKGNPIDSLDVFGKWVRALHAKDGMLPTDGESLGREVRVGTGAVRFPEFLPKLLDLGFEGDLTIEREIAGEEQKKDIQLTIDYLKGILADYAAKKAK